MSLYPTLTKTYHQKPYPAIDPKQPRLNITGKVVLITGGGSGLGPHIAESFIKGGSTTISLLGRTKSTLTATKTDLMTKYPAIQILTFVADISDAESTNTAFQKTREAFGPIDIFVANAAYAPRLETIRDSDVGDWAKGLTTNVIGSFITAQAFLKTCSSDPVLIYVAAALSHLPGMATFSGYTVSKASQLKFYECLQAENPDVRLMIVHPGVLKTDVSLRMVGEEFAFDDFELSGRFMVWAASKEAAFLKGRFLWANWDVEELMEMKEKIVW